MLAKFIIHNDNLSSIFHMEVVINIGQMLFHNHFHRALHRAHPDRFCTEDIHPGVEYFSSEVGWKTTAPVARDITICIFQGNGQTCWFNGVLWWLEWDFMENIEIPSGKHTQSYWTWPCTADFPMQKNVMFHDFPQLCKGLPEGIWKYGALWLHGHCLRRYTSSY